LRQKGRFGAKKAKKRGAKKSVKYVSVRPLTLVQCLRKRGARSGGIVAFMIFIGISTTWNR
jgi:hypothetical protein